MIEGYFIERFISLNTASKDILEVGVNFINFNLSLAHVTCQCLSLPGTSPVMWRSV